MTRQDASCMQCEWLGRHFYQGFAVAAECRRPPEGFFREKLRSGLVFCFRLHHSLLESLGSLGATRRFRETFETLQCNRQSPGMYPLGAATYRTKISSRSQWNQRLCALGATAICLCMLTVSVNLVFTHVARFDPRDNQTLWENQDRSIAQFNGKPEVWALGPHVQAQQQQLASLLDSESLAELRALCGRCLYRTLTSYVQIHDFGRTTVVLTGDIPAMWLRDSAVQMAPYLPRMQKHPGIRQVIEGTIRAQSYFLLQDPWANAFNPKYVVPTTLPKYDRQLGRGGWVWTRNFELDSIAYFLNFLWNYHQTPGLWSPGALLREPLVHDAIVVVLRLLQVEQHHEELSPYRYSELSRGGLGPPCGYTGMVWSAFRASDDPQKYSFNIPDNMYLWGALNRLRRLNMMIWNDPYITNVTQQLMNDVHMGILRHGIILSESGLRLYAYEVDGLGSSLLGFDDPNLPSLLSVPLLGYENFDVDAYQNTRQLILNKSNPFYFEGQVLKGLGSPHTNHRYVWPLATIVDALTSDSPNEQAKALQMVLKMAHGNGLVHESVHVDNINMFTRPEFGWANAMLVVAVEHLLGIDCDVEAEKHRLDKIKQRELVEVKVPPNKGSDEPSYYERLEATMNHIHGKK